VHEEVGLTIELGPLLGLYSETGETVVLAVYSTVRVEGDAVPGDDIEAIEWFSPSALPPLAFSHDQHIVTSWLARKARGTLIN
jgi:8-oxo-dGTP pyrophosphatase MutT (NUDIX family)